VSAWRAVDRGPGFSRPRIQPIGLAGRFDPEGIRLIARGPLAACLAAGALVLALGGALRPAGAEPPRFVRAWSEPGVDLAERVQNARSAALELGLRNVEPAARSLMAGAIPEGIPQEGRLEAVRSAARLAPDVPAAHMDLALALWRQELDVAGGIDAARDALLAFPRNLEASLWLQAAACWAAALALGGGAVLYLALGLLAAVRVAAHDLGDLLSVRTPAVSRAALVGSAILLPAAAGEGLLGACLGCLVAVAVYGPRRAWLVGVLAAGALAAALHPLLAQAGRALAALHADPIALAAHTAEHGFASPMQLARLERASAFDPLAARALALGVKRTGDLAEADARYGALLAETPDDPVLLNNAANVRLALGDTAGAVSLYERSVALYPFATVYFNLSQAWGVALNVVELDAALARAQELDPALVEDLSVIQERAIHFVADLPVPSALLRRRLLAAGDGAAVAADLRRPLAPGVLGASPAGTLLALAAALGAGLLLRGRFRPSQGCHRCGALVCPRCHPPSSRPGLCAACSRAVHQPETTDAGLRAAHAAALARRRAWLDKLKLAAAVALPGAGALMAGRHGLALAACLAAAAAVAGVLARHGPAPDPLAAGAAGPALLVLAALAAALLYAPLLAACVTLSGRGD